MSRHRAPVAPRRPSPLTLRNVSLADALILAAAVVAIGATNVAPHVTQPAAAALPTADVREPSGHGGPLTPAGPLATPSIGADEAWQPDKGPVIVDGQALPAPVVTDAPPTLNLPPANSSPRPDPVTETAAVPEPLAEPPEQPASGLLALVNADRATAGCGPVTIADDLTSQAQTHSNAQAAADSMFHSGGVEGHDSWGENVAYGYGTEAEVHAGWLGSPPHREIIETCSFTLIGWGSADGASGRYWTESFAA